MKNLTVALVFCASMASLFASLRADALSSVRIEQGLSRPEPLSVLHKDGKGGGGGKGGDGKGGGDDKKGGKDDDEEDEEEYRRARYSGLSQRAALELVDPGGMDDVLRLSAGLRFGRR
ncbi:hypothetical protein JY651_33915 [Pyxidicoccus parkwayensis]|jgi:hypothetical protein|uniref:Uncharacterized protein n=1 Tax=Pyxidicoccus parkwayensis TaxID=2813578 RepID=A0ABX7NP80_9BACT|nr:hypothetical protein [Pyxidicoccus parkwaysis]QSQ20233.1 hypothetical protein JY651_33915 [Pyxidicoccus parkwaysis]